MSQRRAEALVRLFDAAPEGVYIGTLEAAGSRTIAVNPHLKTIFGFPPRTAAAAVRPFDEDRFVDPAARRALLQRLESEQPIVDYPLRLRRADDEPIWIELAARGRRAARGHLRIEALVRDVSARRKLEDDTRSIAAQLLQAEKMAALGQTISGVAHELNNPLATILSWSERLAQASAVDPATRRGLDIIRRESERAARIVRTLLTSARKRQSTRALVDVNAIVRETLALRAEAHAAGSIVVVATLAADVPQVFADGYQIQQVLLNLITNAEQAMRSAHGGGQLTVRSLYHAGDDVVVLEIKDDGPGIREDTASRIFDPFFTTKEVGSGTGLGLTVAYAIVSDHGGSIRLESHEGSGTSFFVELPRGGVPLAPPPQAAAPATSAVRHDGAAVLLVEDEQALAAAVIELLRDAGYAVTHAADGQEALDRIDQAHFDLVICDLKMPRVDGKSVFHSIATRVPRLAKRVIFVTGDVAGSESETFLRESGCRFLAKPFRALDLIRTVQETLG